jgi:hypothetical protein
MYAAQDMSNEENVNERVSHRKKLRLFVAITKPLKSQRVTMLTKCKKIVNTLSLQVGYFLYIPFLLNIQGIQKKHNCTPISYEYSFVYKTARCPKRIRYR